MTENTDKLFATDAATVKSQAIARPVGKDDWYDTLLNDITEMACNQLIQLKHAIGKRILQDERKFGKPRYGDKKIESLARDLDMNPREIYFCLAFAKKCDDVTQFKGCSWRFLTHS